MSQVLPRDFGLPQPKPRKKVKQLKPDKWKQAPIKQVGKVTKKWKNFREDYFLRYPGNWLGLHMCAHCGQWLPKSQIDLDHIVKRSLRPDLRFEDTNIQKLCRSCHYRKEV